MNKFTILAFAVGAAVGSAATWYFVKTKYERLAQEEIDSVKETFAGFKKPEVDDKPQEGDHVIYDGEEYVVGPEVTLEASDATVAEYAKLLASQGYTNYSNAENIPEEIPPEPVTDKTEARDNAPYVIPPDQFGEFDDYDTISLMYYADGTLCDDNDEILEDPDNVVGPGATDHFGEYDDDVVYVRNDRLKVDYEILRSLKTYEEVLQQKPYLRGMQNG